jgi:hypothetical protein
MQTQSTTPSDAQRFDKLMVDIWDGDTRNLYTEFSNTNKAARMLFHARRHSPTTQDGLRGVIWNFPDGSRAFISQDGSMISDRPSLANSRSALAEALALYSA